MNFNLKHQTHLETVSKFIFLILILISYFAYLSYKHDISSGVITLGLTWSFFVLCTPVADAGFLLDFPLRLLFGLRMIVVEVFVWALAIFISVITMVFSPSSFDTTLLTRVFYQIISTPYPYWMVIALCCVGTFASIYFGDEMLDVLGHHQRVKHHKHSFKYKAIVLISITCIVTVFYYYLVKELGVSIH